MSITLIAAVSSNGVIGRDNDLPWRIPADLKHFKELTIGKTLLMGRRTYDSIGRALPGRTTVVVTRQEQWSAPGVTTVRSIQEALDLAAGDELMVAGGGDLYAQLMPTADRLEITHIAQIVEGDTYFPHIDPAQWTELSRQEGDGYSFVSYGRI
ncbi:dihydrofolate reductase [Nakamurella antarctica]|uniref:Dihydrofolate reductase n=1 Tax=Nakamurella antarctica TaxID=1902245 RepID=A0A3G8ZTZ2_9ACTN|nr:dihydrofolate reductase [Nakamurella antarctica]AZI57944.1 dihydrofolate reductase [Nakamurella antarctica]